MTSRAPLSARAAEILAREAEGHPDGGVASPSREAMIAVIAQTIRAEKLRRSRRRARLVASAVAGLALAAALVVTVSVRSMKVRAPQPAAAFVEDAGEGLAHNSEQAAYEPATIELHGDGSLVRDGLPILLDEAGHAEPLDRLAVSHGEASLVFAQGSRLSLHEGAEVLVVSTGSEMRVRLEKGAVEADVVPLFGDQRFVIQSDDDIVEVHGTKFVVERVTPTETCADGSPTRVRVQEGVVSVRARGVETLVHRGEGWPSGCDRGDNEDAGRGDGKETATASPVIARPPRPTIATLGRADASPTADVSSELAAQNDLFAVAMKRKHTGDVAGAVVAFDELLTRFPRSHLAHASQAERMRLLRGFDRERARTAARDYLAQHPSGFARADAETILAGP